MNDIAMEGYGYEWDAELVAGPFDGMIDRVIQLEGSHPPKLFSKPINSGFNKTKLGKKVIETWTNFRDEEQLAIYRLRGKPCDYTGDEDDLIYDFEEVTSAKEFRQKYK